MSGNQLTPNPPDKDVPPAWKTLTPAAAWQALQDIKAKQTAGDDRLPTAERVLQASADPQTPLHRIFAWDDIEAARAHRQVMALQATPKSVAFVPRSEGSAS